jgi:hypothetical protein
MLKLPGQIVDAYDSTCAAIFILNYGDRHRYIRDLDFWIYWMAGTGIPIAGLRSCITASIVAGGSGLGQHRCASHRAA